MKKGENRAVNAVVEAGNRFVEENPPPGLELHWGGLPYINVVWQQKMVSGMGKALASSFGVVLVMMIFLFRSIRMGFLSMMPLTATIALVYGFIGYVGKPYDMPIAVLSSLTLGLSIDFAIHFLQRTREALRVKRTIAGAMDSVFGVPARAITRNILVIAIGFVPMFFASLVPYITVGVFFFAIMLISGFTTLFALPASLSLMGPAFLLGKGAAASRGRDVSSRNRQGGKQGQMQRKEARPRRDGEKAAGGASKGNRRRRSRGGRKRKRSGK
jgi:predicted RND superfamily exporter protein